MAVRKKQDDKYLLALRELVNSGAGNRQCFDCNQKGPTYVNMTIGSFVCTRCSGVLRGLTPPHRVKSISMATFTQEELDFLKAHGNELCAKTWLGLWDPKRATPQQDQRELMIDKYERKRYYLEPASPLKSLANAVNLKSSNGYHTSSISNISSNGYASIHLTPPAAQRTAANGLASKTPSTTTTSSAISRPQHHHHQQQPQQQQQDAFNMSSGGLGLISSLNSAGSTSTGALSDTSSCASNGFAGESDFVADFGSANIFDATTSSARSTGSPAVSSASSVSSSNGYAKVQPLRAAHLHQQQQLLNGNGNVNGNGTENFADFEHAPIYNGIAATSYFNWSDCSTPSLFPDPFEQPQEPSLPTYSLWSSESRTSHGQDLSKPREREKPPERAAAYKSSFTSLTSSRSVWSSSCDDSGEDSLAALSSTLTPTNPFLPYILQSSSSTSEAPASRRSSLFSYEEQDPPPIAAESNSNSNSSSNILNAYYNPFFTWSATLQQQQQSSQLGQQSHNSPKGAQVGSSAPSEDRYAALKDLDEQLRELKASEAVATEAPTPTNGNMHMADAFSSVAAASHNNNINNNSNTNANPFKSQQQQQQQQLLNGNGHLVNPFQANNSAHHQQQQQPQQQNLYGQLTLIPNGYGSSPVQAGGQLMHSATTVGHHQQLPHASFFNFNNNGFAVAQGLPNGCGFGSMQPAPVMAGGINGAFNNPFAASGAINTNNPFL
ncbi:arf-GAP domain and FG repeat-containing protein 2 isoform X1 [Drosophila sulfurigaster albostrigata]|uniref:arf-GAP domain and FG repeat-containing protein 2 isoform X1 n=2 Tax=Drosophila sulfurigaster albostrigata TaxID=89887 RepID=UPI002D21D04D|nr:arf-GAP domain and FG repeat-containing protein 2 isoform X1 [Drosophila sulfurigaster albostrigata]